MCRPLALLFAMVALVFAGRAAEKGRTQRHPETIRVGAPAPDFDLPTLDGQRRVRLSEFQGRQPVVLIFGSYTCPPFRDVYPDLERMYRTFGSKVAFFYIYIREAHPEDGWKMPRNQREGITVRDPKSFEERTAVAKEACAFFRTQIPALVDTMDDATDRAYAGWPSRIFVVDTDGRIAVRGEPGPRGLVPAARAAASWLRSRYPELGKTR